MRKSLLTSAAVLGLALPAMAQNTSNTQSPPTPNAGVSQPQPSNSVPAGGATSMGTMPGGTTGGMATTPMGTAQPGMAPRASTEGDMTGMHPMRHPRGAGTHRPMRGQPAAMTGTGARPGHEPGVGDSEPFSDRASNIDRGDTRSQIAPRLPQPNVSSDSPEAYLAAADRALARRQTGLAQSALEHAETRMLNRSVPMGQGNMPDRDPRIEQVNSALQALANRNYSAARQNIQQAMNMGGGAGGSMGQSGMGNMPMNQPGMSNMPMDNTGMGNMPMNQSGTGAMPMGGQTGPGRSGAGLPR